MKKNVVQDIIPPHRTIRNVELPSKTKHNTKKLVDEEETSLPEKLIHPKEVSSYAYEYNEPARSSRKVLYILLGLVVLAIVFGISAMFKSAQIRITPKQDNQILNANLKATKNLSTSGLGFQIVTTTKSVQENVTAGSSQNVDIKATGKIMVYNNYGTQPQKLVATTRFTTPEGLVFRAVNPVTIPGRVVKDGKTVAGSVEVAVIADAPGTTYNVGLKDFTIPGFKGDPRYSQIYGRSETEMSGGFSGMQKVVTKDALTQADKDLEQQLKNSLAKDIVAQIPESFVLYSNSLSFDLDPATQVNSPTDTTATGAVIQKSGTVSAIIFDRGAISQAITTLLLPDLANDTVKITNLDDLKFTFQTGPTFDPNTTTTLNFNLSGQVNFVWTFDENKLKSDLLGLSKKNASATIATYDSIKEAWVETSPFWNQSIPLDPKAVTIINTLTK